MEKVGFIGCGNMGGAIVRGILSSGDDSVVIYEKNKNKIQEFFNHASVTIVNSMQELLEKSTIVVLATKPQSFLEVVSDLNKLKYSDKIVFVSIMAGLTADKIKASMDKCSFLVRVMPNLPMIYNAGVVAVENSSDRDILDRVSNIFSSTSQIFFVSKSQMDVVTALSGSGPAFLFKFVDDLVSATQKEGLEEKLAYPMALQMIKGSVDLLSQSEDKPSTWIEKVSSKGGTTVAGLEAMQENQFSLAVQSAIASATKRSKELSGNS